MFETNIKRVSVRLAVLMFFVMAFVGWMSGLSPATSGARALGGAVVIYIIVRLAGKLIVDVLMRALVNEHIRRHQQPESKK